jgi:hypothetical protein
VTASGRTRQLPIFSDGIEADRLGFNSGTEVQITLAGRKAG